MCTTMVVETLAPPASVAEAFIAIAHRVVWCSLATVDRRGRPRSRLVHPIWEHDARRPRRLAHLAARRRCAARTSPPRRSCRCSYWDPAHDVAVAECAAAWVEDPVTKRHAWEVFRRRRAARRLRPRDDLAATARATPTPAVIRLDPWRLKAADAATLAAGGDRALWRRP